MKTLIVILLLFSSSLFAKETQWGRWETNWECPKLIELLLDPKYELIAYDRHSASLPKNNETVYILKNKDVVIKYLFRGLFEDRQQFCYYLKSD